MNQQIFSNIPEDYLKMTSTTSGYGEEYLKMSDDSASGGIVFEQVKATMDEQNNNSSAAVVLPNSVSSPVALMTPAEVGGPSIEMISMQNLSHCTLPEEDEDEDEASDHQASHYDNLDQVVVKQPLEVVSNGSLKHVHVQMNHHYVSQPIQQTIL